MSNRPASDEARDKKRAQFVEPPPKKSKLAPVAIALLLIAAATGYFLLRGSGNSPAATSVQSQAGKDDVRIPLADLEGGKAKFFDYKLADGKAVRFFALKSSDGQYRAALDACDVCYHSRKGYRQQGNEMICNNCGLKFPSNKINDVQGGCNPIGVGRAIDGDQLLIKASDLAGAGRYF